MTQHAAFVDPATLSLPSSSLKRYASPDGSTDDAASPPAESSRKRPRSAATPEERKEARAHRNRIAAQNSRDRRKAQFSYLERRVAELEEENRRLRAGIHVSSSPSTPALSDPDICSVEPTQDLQRKRQEEQRERENQELRQRIRTLEQGYEAVLRALVTQGNSSLAISTPPAGQAHVISTHPQPCSQPAGSSEFHDTPSSPSSLDMNSLSSTPSVPSSPSSSNSTLVDSPLLFPGGDSTESPDSLALPVIDIHLASTPKALDLSASNAPTRHLARVVNTAVLATVSLQRVSGSEASEREDQAASDATIARLFAEILASPPLGSSALPSPCTSPEDAISKEVLSKTDTIPSGLGLDIGTSEFSTVNWEEQVHAEMEMEKLLEMLPNAQGHVDLDADMDFSSALAWEGISVS